MNEDKILQCQREVNEYVMRELEDPDRYENSPIALYDKNEIFEFYREQFMDTLDRINRSSEARTPLEKLNILLYGN